MLRRAPTAITLTHEDISTYEDKRAAEAHAYAQAIAEAEAQAEAEQRARAEAAYRAQYMNAGSANVTPDRAQNRASNVGAPVKGRAHVDSDAERKRERDARLGLGRG